VAAVRRIDVHALDFADSRTQRMKSNTAGRRTITTRDPESPGRRPIRRGKRVEERRRRFRIMDGGVGRDVRPDQRARIGKCRKLCGGNDHDQRATYWLEEKLSQYHNKIKSIADDFVNLAAAGSSGRLGSRHSGVRMLDMTANRIVLAGVQPDADAVNTTIYLNTFNPL
jgi:hypothetical protein